MAINSDHRMQGAGAVRIKEFFWPKSDEPLWTEFLYFFAVDEKTQRAVSLHIGRRVGNLDVWRASVIAYLPDGQLAIAMVEGKQVSDRRLELGGLVIDIVEDALLWRVRFDGMADRVDRRDNMAGPHRGGVSIPLLFMLDFGGVVPLWDLHSSVGDAATYSRMHHQQIGIARGHFQCEGTAIAFEGMCVRDHSSGPRDYARVEGDFWISALFPSGRAVMAQVVKLTDCTTNAAYLASSYSQEIVLGNVIVHPAVPGSEAGPGSFPANPMNGADAHGFEIVIEAEDECFSMKADLLHSAAMTFYPPADEEPGTDFAAANALQWTESVVRVTHGGEIGFGVRERIAAMGAICPPAF